MVFDKDITLSVESIAKSLGYNKEIWLFSSQDLLQLSV